MAKPTQLTDVSINELSLVFRQRDGSEWAPRNPEALVLGTKAGEVKPNVLEAITAKVAEALKGYFASNDDLSFQYPVSINVPDDIDGDDDGAEDYNAIASALCRVNYDIQAAFGIGDDEARSLAIVAAIRSFLNGLDALRAGDEEKAGARHSAADTASLQGIAQATAVIAGHLNDMQAHLQALGVNAEATDAPDADDEEPAGDKAAPVDTNTEPTAGAASADAAKSGETDNEMTPEEIKALVANEIAAKAAEFDAKLAAKEAELEAEKAKNAEAQAAIDAEKAAAAQAKAEADDLARKAAEKPIGATFVTNEQPKGESRLALAIKAALTNNPIPTVQGG